MNRLLAICTYAMSAVFLLGEIARRGINYFSINATTMMEDLLCGALLFMAATMLVKRMKQAKLMLVGAWGYAFGGMFVLFFAHLEAFLRGVEMRADHLIVDVNSIILKGVIWLLCGVLLLLSLRCEPTSQ
ncbi:hypothetical protein [Vibrio hangzhouensis]|uniref:hypothetical protein n=1 Tax=Vibrio hangzhouensis TaxID=462991 RepID=UPI001C95C227|nr:hypothetical protein [Vibrio hangzhouensis]MBY6196229.1 hypothetical protein [Vibrio hangzhouensis]